MRWFHVLAGIMWLGQTYLFNRLENRLAEVQRAAGKPEPIWLVHSGGFYILHKDKSPPQLPPTLYWFKWESAATWLSGIVLLLVVYYAGGLLTSDPDDELRQGGPRRAARACPVPCWSTTSSPVRRSAGTKGPWRWSASSCS